MSIDYLVRRSVAKWARAVSLEDQVDAGKAAIARRMIESISPATPSQDSALVHVVFLVRVFLDLPDGEEHAAAAVETAVGEIMTAFGRLGAFQG
jgi:hypothetical protein